MRRRETHDTIDNNILLSVRVISERVDEYSRMFTELVQIGRVAILPRNYSHHEEGRIKLQKAQMVF